MKERINAGRTTSLQDIVTRFTLIVKDFIIANVIPFLPGEPKEAVD